MGLYVLAFFAVLGYGGLLSYLHFSKQNTEQMLKIEGSFSLTDQYGKAQTEEIFKGQKSLVFFGYTYCPDICPLSLQKLEAALEMVGPSAKNIKIIFITIDPKRDTPEALEAYLSSRGFPSGVIGLSGSEAQIKRAADMFRASYEKVGSGDSYTMNHTTMIYMLDEKGKFIQPLAHELSTEILAKLIGEALK